MAECTNIQTNILVDGCMHVLIFMENFHNNVVLSHLGGGGGGQFPSLSPPPPSQLLPKPGGVLQLPASLVVLLSQCWAKGGGPMETHLSA